MGIGRTRKRERRWINDIGAKRQKGEKQKRGAEKKSRS